MWLLQREEHQCSCWLKLHCKQILLYFKHILLYFLLASAVHLIQLPMVLLGGQPRSWGMDLGLCPMCLDDLWVSMQRISAKPFFFFSQYTVWHLQGFSSCPLLWLPTVVLLWLLNSVSVLHSYQSWHSFLVQPATSLLFKNNSGCSCFSYPKLKAEKARPLQSCCSLGGPADCAWSMSHTNNFPSAFQCDEQSSMHLVIKAHSSDTQWS